jgi:hypothetical protein
MPGRGITLARTQANWNWKGFKKEGGRKAAFLCLFFTYGSPEAQEDQEAQKPRRSGKPRRTRKPRSPGGPGSPEAQEVREAQEDQEAQKPRRSGKPRSPGGPGSPEAQEVREAQKPRRSGGPELRKSHAKVTSESCESCESCKSYESHMRKQEGAFFMELRGRGRATEKKIQKTLAI